MLASNPCPPFDVSPSNQHIRLILVMLYTWELGCWESGHILMKTLDIKHVQCETLGYILTRFGWSVGEITKAKIMGMSVTDFRSNSIYEAKDQMVQSFHGNIFDKVFEMMDYVKKMEKSVHARYCEVENMFLCATEFTTKLSDYLPAECQAKALEFETSNEVLTDNRDLGLFDDWKSKAIERTKLAQESNFKEVVSWVKFRSALAEVFLLLEAEEVDLQGEVLEGKMASLKEAYQAGLATQDGTKQSQSVLPLKLTTEWQAASSIAYPEIVSSIITLLADLKAKFASQDLKETFNNEKLNTFISLISENFDAQKIFTKVDLAGQIEKEFGAQVSEDDKNSLQAEHDIYFTDLVAAEKTRLSVELVSLLLVNVMRFVSCEKATRTKLCKKSEVYAGGGLSLTTLYSMAIFFKIMGYPDRCLQPAFPISPTTPICQPSSPPSTYKISRPQWRANPV